MEKTEPATNTLPIAADDIFLAAERLEGVIYRTPLLKSESLSKLYDLNVTLKLENTQKTGSFKLRGAYNTIASLSSAERERGLIAASSGNHAQGVAYAAQMFGLQGRTTIYMPRSAPQTKRENTLRYGVNIELVDGTYDDAARAAHAAAAASGATYIEPYNDPRIIAGQGTIGLEIMQDAPQTDVILVPVGGGGLIAGIALAAHTLRPRVRVIGVQAHYARPTGPTIADGIRVAQPGDLPTQIIERYVEQLVHVDEAAAAEAVLALANYTRLLVEGSGAVGLAAIMTGAVAFAPATNVVIVLSGGNIDLTQLGALAAQKQMSS
ncbi:threonine/serine dehydratase [Aggregatilineales bacterium SYSU G02658]